jgi:hypothetical protein
MCEQREGSFDFFDVALLVVLLIILVLVFVCSVVVFGVDGDSGIGEERYEFDEASV